VTSKSETPIWKARKGDQRVDAAWVEANFFGSFPQGSGGRIAVGGLPGAAWECDLTWMGAEAYNCVTSGPPLVSLRSTRTAACRSSTCVATGSLVLSSPGGAVLSAVTSRTSRPGIGGVILWFGCGQPVRPRCTSSRRTDHYACRQVVPLESANRDLAQISFTCWPPVVRASRRRRNNMTYHVLYLPDCLAIANRPHAFVSKTKTDTTGGSHMTKIAQFAEYGDPDVLGVIDAPAPKAGPGQVRVAVRAAGVNPIDAKTVEGLMRNVIPLTLPAGVGTDVSGVVEQVGPGVSEFAVGDEVLGSSVTPSFAEYALAEPASLVRKPHDIPWQVAGSLAGAGGTAYAVLKQLRLKTGETLLIHGAGRRGRHFRRPTRCRMRCDGHRNRQRTQS